MNGVEVVVAHRERATLRVGDVFLKVDPDHARIDIELAAMAMAPIPTPDVLWRKPPVLALAALPGEALGRLGEPSTASPAAWTAAGAAARMLHESPLPPWAGRSRDEIRTHLDAECAWLIGKDVLPAEVVSCNRRIAETALRPWTPVFTHGDLQVTHVFAVGDRITGVIDWSEAGYGSDIDVIHAWWSLRSLLGVRWLVDNGFDPAAPGCEIDVLRSGAMRAFEAPGHDTGAHRIGQ